MFRAAVAWRAKRQVTAPTLGSPLVVPQPGMAASLEARGLQLFEVGVIEVKQSEFNARAAVGVRDMDDVAAFGAYVQATCTPDVTHAFMHAYVLPDGAMGSGDDGEKGAGRAILAVLKQRLHAKPPDGVAVAVSRWYGGVMLGSRRFSVIAERAGAVIDTVPDTVRVR